MAMRGGRSLAWILGGVLSLLGALTYGEMGAMNPEAGGLYVYLRDAFGSLAAFLYGWTLFFVSSTGSVAALAAVFTTHLNELLPLAPVMWTLVPVGLIATAAAINVGGTRESASVTNWTTGIKVGVLLVMSGLLLGAAGGGSAAVGADFQPQALTLSMAAGVGLGLISVLWACEGWQYATFVAGETKDPQRTFPLGIVTGTALTAGIYIVANLAYIVALGSARTSVSQSVAADAMTALIGPMAGKLVAVAILVSIFSAMNAVVLSAPRVFFAMARDGVFFERLARVHPRFGTPAFAVGASALWAIVLTMSGRFEQLLAYVVVIGWMFYGLGGFALFCYRWQKPDAVRPFRVPGYPFTSAVFVLSAAAVVLNSLTVQPTEALIGMAVVLAGTPAYVVWRRRTGAGIDNADNSNR